MNDSERRRLVTRNTAEVVTDEELDDLLENDPTIYVGYAPTGEMHIGHFTTIRKLADFLRADLDVKVLIADLHAHLDDEKSPSSCSTRARPTTAKRSRGWSRRPGPVLMKSSSSRVASSNSMPNTRSNCSEWPPTPPSPECSAPAARSSASPRTPNWVVSSTR